MKVVLIKKCEIGEVGDVVEVKSGYANNFLFKQGRAVKDSDKARQFVQTSVMKKQRKLQVKNDELKNALSKIENNSVLNIRLKANEKGHLYAALSDNELIKALASQLGIINGSLQIALLTTIKELGKFEADISINNKKKKLTINVKQLDDSQTN